MSRTEEHTPLVDLGHERPQVPARARNLSPIVPRASISGRALVAVVAIMTFLASITTGAVLLVSASAGVAVGCRQRNHHPDPPKGRP
jgi:cell division transport system permease protein